MAKRKTNKIRPPKKRDAFLAAYRECGNITHAAKLAKCHRTMHYQWFENDPDYPALFEDATQEACENLEAEARRRAVQGTDKPVFYQGAECGAVREYSDTLLIFLLKGAMPGKYRERVEHSGEVTNKHDIRVVEDGNWYGNADRLRAVTAPPSN